jgi:hypothetical protein
MRAKLVAESFRNFIEYGKFKDTSKETVLKLLDELSIKNEEVQLTDEGLLINEIEVNTKRNYIKLPAGSKIFLSNKEVLKIYNKILKNSFQ